MNVLYVLTTIMVLVLTVVVLSFAFSPDLYASQQKLKSRKEALKHFAAMLGQHHILAYQNNKYKLAWAWFWAGMIYLIVGILLFLLADKIFLPLLLIVLAYANFRQASNIKIITAWVLLNT